MIRTILRDTAGKLRVTLYVGSTPTNADPGGVHVTVVRDSDGQTIVNNQAATSVAGETGVYEYTLAPADIPDLDLLRATWTASVDGVADQMFVTEAEVVGQHIVELAQIKAAAVGGTYTDEQLAEGRDYAEQWIEDACATAFRPRYRRERRSSRYNNTRGTLKLDRARPLALRSVSLDGTALTAPDLAAVRLEASGVLYRTAGWFAREGGIELVYEYGHEVAPGPVVDAVLDLAADYLLPDPTNFDRRASRIDTEDASYAMVTPGVRGAVSSIPTVNAVVEQYGYRSIG